MSLSFSISFLPSSRPHSLIALRRTPPKAGSICFPVIVDVRYKDAGGMCQKLVAERGVMLLPGDVYSHNDMEFPLHERFRLGFGRKNMKQALEEFGSFLDGLRK